MMSNVLLSDPSLAPFLLSTMPGTYIDHPLIQKNPEVLYRQCVDPSRPTNDMAKKGLTRAFTSVKAMEQLR
jgi:hypothetical protein